VNGGKAPAWLLPITGTITAAVGEFELVHILPDPPALFGVPRAPHYCREVLVWQGRILPLMDLAARFDAPGRKPALDAARVIVGIVAYRPEQGADALGYGGLALHSVPQRCRVGDDQACSLPPWLAAWTPYVSACFQPEGPRSAVPVLRLERLFASPGAAALRSFPE
jgi:chemotaxis signal transduction protein